MGFTLDGNFLISYKLIVEDGEGVNDSLHVYSLHWWRFNLNKPLRKVWSVDLFQGYNIQESLQLLICQPIGQSLVTVVGCRKGMSPLDPSICYVSIVSSPIFQISTEESHKSIHIHYDLLPPFPGFIPSLCLRLENCVILNTGCSLSAVQYQMSPAHDKSSLISYTSDTYCTCIEQTFVNQNELNNYDRVLDSQPFSSPTHILPLEVYKEKNVLTEVAIGIEEIPVDMVKVYQRSVDLEQWLSDELLKIMSEHSLFLNCISDYDIQIVEVCELEWIVAFLVVAITESSGLASPIYEGYHKIQLLACWYILVGRVELISHTIPTATQPPATSCPSHTVWNPARSCANSLRQALSSTCFVHHPTVQVFSNHTVLSGMNIIYYYYIIICMILISKVKYAHMDNDLKIRL